MLPFAAPIRRRGCRSPAWGATEMRLYLIIALAILAMAVSAGAQTVMVQSGRYADFRQLLSREAPANSATLAMTLRLPDEARDRYPAVVIVHTIARLSGGERRLARRRVSQGRLRHPDLQQRRGAQPARGPALSGRSGLAVGRRRGLRGLSAAGRSSQDRRQPHRHRRLLVRRRGRALDGVGTTACRAGTGRGAICRSCRLLSGGRLRRRGRAGRLHGRADPDAVGRKGRQSARGKGAGLSRLCQTLRESRRPSTCRSIPAPITPGRFRAWALRTSTRSTAARENVRIFYWDRRRALLVDGHEAPMDPNVMQTCRRKARATRWPTTRRPPSPPARPGFSLEDAATLTGQATRRFCAATEPAHWSTGRGRSCRS